MANGAVIQDQCGVCDDKHAARWPDPNIRVTVDDGLLPLGLSQSDWRQAVKQSFLAWESVSGSSLKFIQKGNKSPRHFGANDAVHEIFWVTNKEEWRRLVGSGEFGTLGATVPRYSCGGALGSGRVIFDADLVLNGLPHINWQLDCQDEDCISVQTTLVHELGHFFGLDHPCLLCSTSIMSARAGYDLIYPVLDDMEGLRVLYPDGSSGGFGSPCVSDADCNNENRCVEDSPHRYCSNDCKDDDECSLGSICKANEENRVCGFLELDEELKQEGENCMLSPCAEPLVCAGAAEPNFFCFKPCARDSDCLKSQACVDLDDKAGVCVTIKEKGSPCNHRDLCEEHLYCVFNKLTSGFCYAPCDLRASSKSRCAADEACELIEGVPICVPKNQPLALDEASAGFSNNEGKGPLGGNDSRPAKQPAALGCYNLGDNNDLNSVLLLAAILMIAARRTRGDQHKSL